MSGINWRARAFLHNHKTTRTGLVTSTKALTKFFPSTNPLIRAYNPSHVNNVTTIQRPRDWLKEVDALFRLEFFPPFQFFTRHLCSLQGQFQGSSKTNRPSTHHSQLLTLQIINASQSWSSKNDRWPKRCVFFQMWRTKSMKQRGMQKVKLFRIFLISDYLKVDKGGQICLFCSGAKDICSVMWQTCFPYGDHIIGWLMVVMAETALRFLKFLWSNFKSFEIKRLETPPRILVGLHLT